MPITHQPGTALAFQQQFRPIGRIRTGQQVEYTNRAGRRAKRPARLETFRLTSADERMLQRAAVVYGGNVEEWPEAPDGDALQLVTGARELDVLVPGGQPLSQWYEQWGAGGCLRRCTGDEETLSGGPCQCPADPGDRTELAAKGDACKPTTRVNLLLPDMDIGAWLLVTHSYYAAVELPPVVTLLADFASRSQRPAPAKLWIDQRRNKRPGQPTKEFSVPALRTPVTWAGLLAAGDAPDRPALPARTERVPAQLPQGETVLPDDPEATQDGPGAAPRDAQLPDATDTASAAPSAPVVAGEPTPEPETLGGFEEPPPDPPAAAVDLVTLIREAAEASKKKGQMTADQRSGVYEQLVTPLGAVAFRTVVTAAYGPSGFTSPSAAQAAGLITVADSYADPGAFVADWTAAANAIPSQEE